MDFTAAAQRWFLTDTHCHFRTLQNIYFYADEKIKIAFVITFQNLLSLIFLSNLKSFSIFFWTLKLYHVIQKFECYLRNKTEHFLNLSIKTNQKYWILTFWRTHRFQISQAKTRRKNVQKCNFWHLKWTNKSLSTIGIMGNYRLCSPSCDQFMIFEVSAFKLHLWSIPKFKRRA